MGIWTCAPSTGFLAVFNLDGFAFCQHLEELPSIIRVAIKTAKNKRCDWNTRMRRNQRDTIERAKGGGGGLSHEPPPKLV